MKMTINRILLIHLLMKYVKILKQWHLLWQNMNKFTTGDLKPLLQILMLKKRQRLNWKIRMGLVVSELNKANTNITRTRMRMSTIKISLSVTGWNIC